MKYTWFDLTEQTIELVSGSENKSKRWGTLILNPGVITEVNITVQADTFLRAPEEGGSLCGRFSLTKHYIFYSVSPEWWCYSEFIIASLSHTRSLPMFGGQVSMYMPLFYICWRYIDYVCCMISECSCSSGHTMTFLKKWWVNTWLIPPAQVFN